MTGDWEARRSDIAKAAITPDRPVADRLGRSPEGQPVFWDGKGNFSLEKNDDFSMAAHFQKVLPGDDPEAFRQKAAEQLGIDVQYEEY